MSKWGGFEAIEDGFLVEKSSNFYCFKVLVGIF